MLPTLFKTGEMFSELRFYSQELRKGQIAGSYNSAMYKIPETPFYLYASEGEIYRHLNPNTRCYIVSFIFY